MKTRTRQSIRIFWSHAARYPWAVFGVFLGVGAAEAAFLYQPFVVRELIDGLSLGDPTITEHLLSLVWLIFTMSAIGWLSYRVATFTDSFLSSRVMSDILNTCYKYLIDHSYSFFTNDFVGSLVRRVTRFTKVYEILSDRIVWNLWPTLVVMSTVVTVLWLRHWLLGFIVIVWSVIYFIFTYHFISFKMKYDIERAEVDSATSGHIADTITNNINLKLFGGTKQELKTFERLTEKLFRLRWFGWNLDSFSEAIQGAFMVMLELAIFYYAVIFWRDGFLTVGDFVLIQVYLMKVFRHLWDVGKYVRKIFESLAEAEEMTEILDTKHEIVDAPHASSLEVSEGSIAFDGVTFGYHQKKPILKNFNLAIAPGERIALIGPSGGGKSTIVKLLFRFYDINSGAIKIDGQDIAQVTQDSLRDAMALVPQEPILFHRTLMENIRYAKPDASEEEVIKAAKLAHAHEFISKFPEGYESYVGERGVKLSGGERQRVAIARAILKDSPILVLDEATSSLDSESERYIQEALSELMKGRTTIVIAHRLSTIMQMDRILVIEKGKITEEGKHKELLKVNQGTYQKLWQIQAGGFS